MHTDNPLISIIVVNYNGMEFLQGFFTSVFSQTYKNFELIMVDNGSMDESIVYTKEHYPKVKIIENRKNSGYAGGANLGYKTAQGEYIIITNNDVIYEADMLEKLLQAFQEIPNLGVVQPMYRLMNDRENLDACGSFWTYTGFNYHYGVGKKATEEKYQHSFPIYSVKGVCMMIPKTLIEKVDLFDEDYWCYFEETDFCHRVWLSGYECWYYPKTFLYHYNGGTRLKKAEAFVQFHSFKNRLKSYLKNLGVKEFLKIMPFYIALNIIWSIAHLVKLDIYGFMVVYKSVWWNLKHIGKIMRERKHVQRDIRKKQDKEIFAKVEKNPRASYYFYLLKGLKYYAD